MEILSQQEVEQVSGGRISVSEGAAATIGLMAIVATSPVVIVTGSLALVGYAIISLW